MAEEPIKPAEPQAAAPAAAPAAPAPNAAAVAAAAAAAANRDIVAQLLDPEENKPKIVKAKGSKNIATGVVHVQASFNNTITHHINTTALFPSFTGLCLTHHH